MKIKLFSFAQNGMLGFDDKMFVDGLNAAYGDWGNIDFFYDAFGRNIVHPSDIIVFCENGEYVSGLVIVYRHLFVGGKKILISILCGGWTLPSHRNRGMLTHLFTVAKKLVRARKGSYATGFVMASNASCRRVRAGHAIMVPSHYIFYDKPEIIDSNAKFEILQNPNLKEFYAKNKSSFLYSYDEFCRQYICPNQVCIRVNDNYALIDETFNALKINFITYNSHDELKNMLAALVNYRKQTSEKKLFLYTTNSDFSNICKSFGCSTIDGFFMLMQLVDEHIDFSELTIQMGDKM